jgi:quercetin dioxygenase-like cupin family protein
VIKGRAKLEIEGQTVLLVPGNSRVVAKGALHRYGILESSTAVEATYSPTHVHRWENM